ncbi:MAG: DUF1610 domain-containing protein [Synechococcaceae cyanobacterium SM2_3_2]|nr:DUF1610 domain-containing protein [Synechococcaceae cyanobacterium SM2_3_2]
MNPNTPRTYSISLSGWGFWLSALGGALLLSWIGLGWVVAALLGLLVFLLSLPLMILLAFRWWARRRIATDTCPVCEFESQAIEGSRFLCPNCGEALFVADGEFYRQTPSGIIEVELLD